MGYRSTPPSDVSTNWVARKVDALAAIKRFEVASDGPEASFRYNTNDAAEALRLARLYRASGCDVTVRDRTQRSDSLTETDLEGLCDG